jgi:hypothetical protein
MGLHVEVEVEEAIEGVAAPRRRVVWIVAHNLNECVFIVCK